MATNESLKEEVRLNARALELGVHEIQATVDERVKRVRNTVRHLGETAHELSPAVQVRRRPWLTLGAAGVVGFMAVRLLAGRHPAVAVVSAVRQSRFLGTLGGALAAAVARAVENRLSGHYTRAVETPVGSEWRP